jgi:molecular chaperone GrpE
LRLAGNRNAASNGVRLENHVNDQRTTGVGEAPLDEQPTTPSEEEFDKLRAERDEFKDLLLRKSAEFENYRRRNEKERRDLVEFANADLLGDILPLLDNLERAIGSASETQNTGDPAAALEAYRAGIDLIRRQFVELLRKKGVTPIEALGTDFDPHLHQAVTRDTSDAHREGEVMAELQRGYKLGDRLLRPAMVKVATRE